jgi:hypothetical protein
MRTTLVINDELFISAKKLAAERGCSMSAMVNEALRNLVERQDPDSKERPEFRIPTFEGKGKVVDSQPVELTELSEEQELAPFKG